MSTVILKLNHIYLTNHNILKRFECAANYVIYLERSKFIFSTTGVNTWKSSKYDNSLEVDPVVPVIVKGHSSLAKY